MKNRRIRVKSISGYTGTIVSYIGNNIALVVFDCRPDKLVEYFLKNLEIV